MVIKTLHDKPRDAIHWSSRGMTRRLSCGKSLRCESGVALACNRIVAKLSSCPPIHCSSTKFTISSGCNPPDQTLVLYVDERSQLRALDRTQPILPMMLGVPERHTHDYSRLGATTLFAALNIATGKVIGELHPRHRTQEFLGLLRAIEKAPSVKRSPARHRGFPRTFHATAASWLNQVERRFAPLTQRQIRLGTHPSTVELEKTIRNYLNLYGKDPNLFVWTETADQI